MELLERQSSLAELSALARQARSGAGAVVLLSGEAGVGKTALLERFQRELPDARWSWGSAATRRPPRWPGRPWR